MTDIVINGWRLFLHPLFIAQFEDMMREVATARAKQPQDYKKKRCTKLLAATRKVAFELIPNDPTAAIFRQGSTLGDAYKHWFRAKFVQQYRLFFRYDLKSKIIILVWVNDEDTKRAYESSTDAYAVFRSMLQNGNPPDNWDSLFEAAQTATQEFPHASAMSDV
ncbi:MULTISPECIES: type II toxin-antitoxin system YhaV family toxin [Agrobacterium]|uniref:type II toxin-antitoxin system YhaV family toxin n=1 Tax=Agrobacterium TaxID=357 RepID=UPI00097DE741|nr:type II toxin-antitoxin system YhaV family toxin [Agrobacterium sp. DSM 25558]